MIEQQMPPASDPFRKYVASKTCSPPDAATKSLGISRFAICEEISPWRFGIRVLENILGVSAATRGRSGGGGTRILGSRRIRMAGRTEKNAR